MRTLAHFSCSRSNRFYFQIVEEIEAPVSPPPQNVVVNLEADRNRLWVKNFASSAGPGLTENEESVSQNQPRRVQEVNVCSMASQVQHQSLQNNSLVLRQSQHYTSRSAIDSLVQSQDKFIAPPPNQRKIARLPEPRNPSVRAPVRHQAIQSMNNRDPGPSQYSLYVRENNWQTRPVIGRPRLLRHQPQQQVHAQVPGTAPVVGTVQHPTRYRLGNYQGIYHPSPAGLAPPLPPRYHLHQNQALNQIGQPRPQMLGPSILVNSRQNVSQAPDITIPAPIPVGYPHLQRVGVPMNQGNGHAQPLTHYNQTRDHAQPVSSQSPYINAQHYAEQGYSGYHNVPHLRRPSLPQNSENEAQLSQNTQIHQAISQQQYQGRVQPGSIQSLHFQGTGHNDSMYSEGQNQHLIQGCDDSSQAINQYPARLGGYPSAQGQGQQPGPSQLQDCHLFPSQQSSAQPTASQSQVITANPGLVQAQLAATASMKHADLIAAQDQRGKPKPQADLRLQPRGSGDISPRETSVTTVIGNEQGDQKSPGVKIPKFRVVPATHKPNQVKEPVRYIQPTIQVHNNRETAGVSNSVPSQTQIVESPVLVLIPLITRIKHDNVLNRLETLFHQPFRPVQPFLDFLAGRIGVEELGREIGVDFSINDGYNLLKAVRIGLVEKIISLSDLNPVLSGIDCNFQSTPSTLQSGAYEPFEDFLRMMDTSFLANNKTATKQFWSLLDWNITFQEFAMQLNFKKEMYNESYLNFLAYFHTDFTTASSICRRYILSIMTAPSLLPNLGSTVPADGAVDPTNQEALHTGPTNQEALHTDPANQEAVHTLTAILQDSNEKGNLISYDRKL